MSRIIPSAVRRTLEIGTDKRLLQWQPALAVMMIMALVHLLTSVDLGFRGLALRIPLAALSMAPVLLLVALAHRIVRSAPRWQIPLVLSAYLAGGALRGWILDAGLRAADLLQSSDYAFRIPAGAILVTIDAIVVNYAWHAVQQAKETIAQLNDETTKLEEALISLAEESREQEAVRALALSTSIMEELTSVARVPSGRRQAELQRLVDEVVRPLSRDLAKDVGEWRPHEDRNLRVTFKSIWQSLDPLLHLPSPLVASLAVLVAAASSLVSVFGWRIAVEMAVAIVAGLSGSMYAGNWVGRRFLRPLRPPQRDVFITIGLVLVAIPPTYATTIILEQTAQRTAYVLPALITVPIFGWLMMIGGAAWQRTQEVTSELHAVRDELRWSIARINLLSWHRRGVISRLLHGPIQNTLQVGLMRIRSSGDEDQADGVIEEIMQRIDASVQSVTDEHVAARADLQALADTSETWAGIADVSLTLSSSAEGLMEGDPRAAGIVVDLVQEACSNAIRHGGARTLSIEVDEEPALLRIQIVDDGKPYLGSSEKTGLGSQFLDACTISWERARVADRNVLTMWIPVIPALRY